MPRFLNPYNFVRPLPAPRLAALNSENAEHYLLWRCPPPPQDRYTGLSGRITCKMTAKTPVFVSDSEIVSDIKGHKTYRFFNVNGQDIIPASSLRGPIRSIFEAVTNSTWSIFTDQSLSYRETTNNANKLVPGRLELNAETRTWQFIKLDGGQSVPRSLLPAASVPFDLLDNSNIEWTHGQLCFAIMHVPLNSPNLVVDAILPYQDGTKVTVPQQYLNDRFIKSPGYLCITGRNAENKKNERFFFRTKSSPPLNLARDVIEAYNTLIKNAIRDHADRIAKFTENDEWDENEPEPSRFLLGSPQEEIIGFKNTLVTSSQHQFLAYAQIQVDENSGESVVTYLAPVSIPRVLEARSLYQILTEEKLTHTLPATDYQQLSLADRVFGWVSQQAKDDNNALVAYRSRVRFSDAQLAMLEPEQPQPQPLGRISLSILSAPKPTTTRAYVDPARGISTNINELTPSERHSKYNDNTLRYGRKGNRLRGRKIYRHHGRLWRLDDEAKIADERLNSDQNRTIVGTHNVGTSYTFSISFENLQPVELGALLWTLQLNDGDFQGYHRLGYGKPLGFGSVQITTVGLVFDDPGARYSLHDSELSSDGLPQLSNLIQRFKTAMGALYNTPFEELINVQDLKALLSEPTANANVDRIHYPRSRRVRNRKDGDKNYEWFMDNKRPSNSGGPNFVLPYAIDDTDGFPYMVWDNRSRRVQIDD